MTQRELRCPRGAVGVQEGDDLPVLGLGHRGHVPTGAGGHPCALQCRGHGDHDRFIALSHGDHPVTTAVGHHGPIVEHRDPDVGAG